MLRQLKRGTHHPTRRAAHRTTFASDRDPLRQRAVPGPARSRCVFRAQALKHLAPRRAGIAIPLEIGQGIIQNPFFGGAGPGTSDDFLLLQFTKLPKDLISLLGGQFRQLGKDLGFTHQENLNPPRGKRQAELTHPAWARREVVPLPTGRPKDSPEAATQPDSGPGSRHRKHKWFRTWVTLQGLGTRCSGVILEDAMEAS